MTLYRTEMLVQGAWLPVMLNDVHTYRDPQLAYLALTYLSLRYPTSTYRVFEGIK